MRHIKEELVDNIFLNSDLFFLNEEFLGFFRWASFAPSQGPNPRRRRRGCFEQRNLQMPFLFRNICQSFINVWGEFSMMHHDVSRSITMYHDLSWCITIYHDVSWCCKSSNAIFVWKHFLELHLCLRWACRLFK